MPDAVRPLTLGEILDRTVQIYRRNFLLMTGIGMAPSAADVLVTGVFSIFFVSRGPLFANAGKANSPEAAQQIGIVMLAVAAIALIGIPLLLAVFSVALGALNYATLKRNRSEAATVRASYGYGFRHFWRHVGILFLQSLFAGVIPFVVLVFVFFVFGVVAVAARAGMGRSAGISLGIAILGVSLAILALAVWIWLRFSLAFAASVAEDKPAWASMMRSNRLSKGTRGRILVMYLMMTVLAFVATEALVIPLDLAMGVKLHRAFAVGAAAGAFPLAVQIANLAVAFLMRTMVMPIPAIALVLFFNDQRTRNEGYDIEQLMEQAGWQAPPPLAEPAPVPAAWSSPAAEGDANSLPPPVRETEG